MNLPPMLCLSIKGAHGRTWSVMAMFDSKTQKLQTFSLLRVEPWKSLQIPPATA